MKTSRTTFPLYEQDKQAIAAIRAYYGVRSDAEAIRIALRETHRLIASAVPDTPAPNKERRFHPQP
jgi:Spy/CpxP family protein refolding chaperone